MCLPSEKKWELAVEVKRGLTIEARHSRSFISRLSTLADPNQSQRQRDLVEFEIPNYSIHRYSCLVHQSLSASKDAESAERELSQLFHHAEAQLKLIEFRESKKL